MGDFHRCIELVLAEEGGLSDHPADPGGLTKYGISQRAYPQLNIAALTLDDAKALYRRDYWQVLHGDQLPSGLDLLVLDCAINQGLVTAIKLLQRALQIHDDGICGPITLNHSIVSMPDVMDAFAAERALRYELNPNEATFGRGWYRRLLRMNRHAWAMLETAPMVQP
jgi:lysozyme family protein